MEEMFDHHVNVLFVPAEAAHLTYWIQYREAGGAIASTSIELKTLRFTHIRVLLQLGSHI